MASLSTYDYYKQDLKQISRIRALAETLINSPKVKKVDAAEAYELAIKQPGVTQTDLPIYPPAAKRLGLPNGAKILNDTHGKIVGRTAKARRFYNRMNEIDQLKVEGDAREAIFQMQQHDLIKAEAVLGLDSDLMIKATFVTTISDACNVFNWLVNFTPFENMIDRYSKSKQLPIQDIIIVAFNEWQSDDDFYNNTGQPQLALVDEQHNTIFNFGMRYFGERKKGTLTLAWTSGMRMGMAASHAGIKEIDFSGCADPRIKELGKKSIAFYGLSGTGKSSHTNSVDNGKTLPEGIVKATLHDDAFQIDCEEKVCRVWEPSMFDKTDSRPIDHPDWKYCISVQNHSILNVDGKNLPVGFDLRNANGRALFDRELLGKYVNRCSFPKALVWLMKDTVLPPVIKFTDKYLAVAMGAALITKRNRAENVSEEELKKMVFEPFANPFRVYELYKDVEAFLHVIEGGAEVYTFNSGGFWMFSDKDTQDISLQTSLTMQTAILTNQLEWEEWSLLPGAMVPTQKSVEDILPGYQQVYNPHKRKNMSSYVELLQDRFEQRKAFLSSTDLKQKLPLLSKLIAALQVSVPEKYTD